MGADRIQNGGLANGQDAVDSPGALIVDTLNGILGLVNNNHQVQTMQAALAAVGAQTAVTAITTAQNLWTKRRAVELLVKMVESESKPGDVLAVVKVLNAMHGFDGPGEDEGGDGKPSTVVLVIGGQNIDPKKLGW